MSVRVVSKEQQAYGEFNGGAIVENKPVGFPREGGALRAYSNIFYWANAIALEDSTIGLHPHQGFEIMSIVLAGTIRHYDTKAKEWIDLKAGDVQVIQAGNGISHAEHMNEGSRMFQIWFDPNLDQSLQKDAQYADYESDDFEVSKNGELEIQHIAGPQGKVQMDAKVTIQKWSSNEYIETPITLLKDTTYSVYVLDGVLSFGKWKLQKDDYAVVNDLEEITLKGHGTLLVIATPKELKYKTYADNVKYSQS